MTRNLFRAIKERIHEEYEENIVCETSEKIVVEDPETELPITIFDPIHRSQIYHESMHPLPSANRVLPLDYRKIGDWLEEHADPNAKMLLKGIYFLGNNTDEGDLDYITENVKELDSLIDYHDFPCNELGKTWFREGIIFVDLEAIVNGIDEMVISEDICEKERLSVIQECIMDTLIHELRHVAQQVPCIRDEEMTLGRLGDDEEDAESYARLTNTRSTNILRFSRKGLLDSLLTFKRNGTHTKRKNWEIENGENGPDGPLCTISYQGDTVAIIKEKDDTKILTPVKDMPKEGYLVIANAAREIFNNIEIECLPSSIRGSKKRREYLRNAKKNRDLTGLEDIYADMVLAGKTDGDFFLASLKKKIPIKDIHKVIEKLSPTFAFALNEKWYMKFLEEKSEKRIKETNVIQNER